jgi:hypothetical protein
MDLQLSQETMNLLKGLRKDTTTQGITSLTGLVAYNLEPNAKNIYPVFYPLLASTPRVNPTWQGKPIGGTGVNWKAIVGIDSGGYPATSEGNRNAFMNITERNYSALFKFLGKDNQTSFQAQQMGLGFDDNIALAQLSLLNALLNQEEMMLLFGNSGTANGGNGFLLGQTSTPVGTATNAASSTIPTGTSVSAFCVALTGWGVTLATATGLYLPTLRANADNSYDVIYGGTGIISAASNAVVTSGAQSVTFVVPPSVGAMGYGWYIDSTDASPTSPNKANAYFAGVTSWNAITLLALPSHASGVQKANATGSNTGANSPGGNNDLTGDNSFNSLDFDGICTWAFGTAANTQPAYLKDLQGAGFTSNGDGTIAEFEAVADALWLQYKISPDAIYMGGNLIQAASRAVFVSSSGTGAVRIEFQNNAQGAATAGQLVAEYRWKYSNTASSKTIPMRAHPWLPQGVVLFDLTNNPYPAAGNSIPAVRRIVSLEDHFSIRWPYRKLQHEVGVYAFETLEHYIPFGQAILVGVQAKVN